MISHLRDGLDVAIDHVATKLVSVVPDEALADRIVARLPERPSSWTWLIPQVAAAIGVALVAFFLFSNRPTPVAGPSANREATVQPPIVIAPAPRKGAPYETVLPATVVARKAPAVAQVDSTFDRDFGLKPVAGPKEIALAAIDTTPAIDVPSVQVAPIALTDLPLASDSPSPR